MNKRDTQLDILKGIGILLVVFAHVCHGSISRFIYLFHMPLFFFLSGAALNYSKNNDINWGKRFKHIMVPYFVFSVVCFLYWCFVEVRFRPTHDASIFTGLLGTLDSIWQQFANILLAFSYDDDTFLYNVVLWFLLCLFVATIIYSALRKWLGRYTIFGIVLLTSIVFVFSDFRLPWCTEISIVALPFIFGGELLYGKMKNWNPVIFLGVFVSIVLIYLFKPHVGMRSHVFGEWWLFYLVAFPIIISLCVFSRYLVGRERGVLEWLGKNSLLIMCIHEPVKRVLLVVISILSGMEIVTLRESAIISIGITLLLVGLLTPGVFAINRYIPFVLGKSNVEGIVQIKPDQGTTV